MDKQTAIVSDEDGFDYFYEYDEADVSCDEDDGVEYVEDEDGDVIELGDDTDFADEDYE